MDFKFNCEFGVTSDGYLNPIVYSTDLSWGKSKFTHDDWFFALILDNWTKFMMVIIQNAIYFLGDYIFTGMLEPPLTQLMNQYMLPIHLPIMAPGQDGEGDFTMDFRMT
jgi:hypothetical protein